MKIKLIAQKKQLRYPLFLGLFSHFLKADSYPPIQALRKAKEPKDRGWRVTSCNFHLLVKNNFNACLVVFVLIESVLNTCK